MCMCTHTCPCTCTCMSKHECFQRVHIPHVSLCRKRVSGSYSWLCIRDRLERSPHSVWYGLINVIYWEIPTHHYRFVLISEKIAVWTGTSIEGLPWVYTWIFLNIRYFDRYINLLSLLIFTFFVALWLLPWLQEMEVSDNPSLRRDTSDPTLICTAYKKNRFYLFTRKDPDDIKG